MAMVDMGTSCLQMDSWPSRLGSLGTVLHSSCEPDDLLKWLFQRCGVISVLGEEIGPHNATAPGTSLAEDLRAHPVPFVCPGLPMFAW